MRRQIRTKAYCSVKLFVKLPRSFTGVRCNFEEAIQVASEFFKRSDTFFFYNVFFIVTYMDPLGTVMLRFCRMWFGFLLLP